jgi:hypothetical protein
MYEEHGKQSPTLIRPKLRMDCGMEGYSSLSQKPTELMRQLNPCLFYVKALARKGSP